MFLVLDEMLDCFSPKLHGHTIPNSFLSDFLFVHETLISAQSLPGALLVLKSETRCIG